MLPQPVSKSQGLNTLQPRMSSQERVLFESFLGCAANYLEFGAGGSTYVAANLVRCSVTSVDSSRDWLKNVEIACKGLGSAIVPNLLLADIGPIGDWGVPTDPGTRGQWPSYHEQVWQDDQNAGCDLFFVDGRFRVACCMQILKRCSPDSFLIVHDFKSRAHYHVLKDVAREVASAQDLSVFCPIRTVDSHKIDAILFVHQYNPA